MFFKADKYNTIKIICYRYPIAVQVHRDHCMCNVRLTKGTALATFSKLIPSAYQQKKA